MAKNIPKTGQDWSRPVTNQSWSGPVRTGLVTAKDHKRLVCCSLVWFLAVSGIGRTGYGYSLRHWVPKDQTKLDFQTLIPHGIGWNPGGMVMESMS